MSQRKQTRDMLAEAKAIALERFGTCLSTSYVGPHGKLRWKCARGHEWWASYANIQQQHWCPDCSSSHAERTCRAILERMFDVIFERCRPPFLRSAKGAMELDGYNDAIKIAFEYQGIQHTKVTPRQSPEGLASTQERDALKLRLCSEAGVALIVIPTFPRQNSVAVCVGHIKTAILAAGLECPDVDIPDYLPELWDPLESVFGAQTVADMRKLASERGGGLRSTSAYRKASPLTWLCGQGHTWEQTWDRTRNGDWCPTCHPPGPDSLTQAKRIAESRGGICLSVAYPARPHILDWQCAIGHQWKAPFPRVKMGSWCPHCNGNARGSLERAVALAEKNGGKCLSTTYKNNKREKLTWQCERGHVWEAILTNIARGGWCKTCWLDRRFGMNRPARRHPN